MRQCDPRVSRELQPCNFAQAKDAEMQFFYIYKRNESVLLYFTLMRLFDSNFFLLFGIG